MIEVEKKFQPTEEQLAKLLEGAEFVKEVTNHDIYYDYPDFRLFKQNVIFRNRNGNFELKINLSYNADKEIEDEEEIKNYFSAPATLEEFVTDNLLEYVNYKQHRKKYKKEDFNIDVDILDFGVSSCDIEMMVSNEEDIEEAEKKLFDFARNYGLEPKNLLPKRGEYLKRFKPEIFNELFKDFHVE